MDRPNTGLGITKPFHLLSLLSTLCCLKSGTSSHHIQLLHIWVFLSSLFCNPLLNNNIIPANKPHGASSFRIPSPRTTGTLKSSPPLIRTHTHTQCYPSTPSTSQNGNSNPIPPFPLEIAMTMASTLKSAPQTTLLITPTRPPLPLASPLASPLPRMNQ